jgi:hypothetical protein
MVSFAKLLRIRQEIGKKYKNMGLENFLLSNSSKNKNCNSVGLYPHIGMPAELVSEPHYMNPGYFETETSEHQLPFQWPGPYQIVGQGSLGEKFIYQGGVIMQWPQTIYQPSMQWPSQTVAQGPSMQWPGSSQINYQPSGSTQTIAQGPSMQWPGQTIYQPSVQGNYPSIGMPSELPSSSISQNTHPGSIQFPIGKPEMSQRPKPVIVASSSQPNVGTEKKTEKKEEHVKTSKETVHSEKSETITSETSENTGTMQSGKGKVMKSEKSEHSEVQSEKSEKIEKSETSEVITLQDDKEKVQNYESGTTEKSEMSKNDYKNVEEFKSDTMESEKKAGYIEEVTLPAENYENQGNIY